MSAPPHADLNIEYYYRKELLDSAAGTKKHADVQELLRELRGTLRIREFRIQESNGAFLTEADKQQLFETLRDFSQRHHVALGQPFGSRRQGFWYLPGQFLLVHEMGVLREVFPCRIDAVDMEPLQFLKSLLKGEAWAISSSPHRERGKHKELIARIVDDHGLLESGLKLLGANVMASCGFGELGYVDLVFRDSDGFYLLVEVKVRADEIDKAIGQILRHRELFAGQNMIAQSAVRLAIACPHFPRHHRQTCERVGISCFEILVSERPAH